MNVSMVIPLFNEADSLPELHTRLASVLVAAASDFEIIFIDDGSSDSSLAVLAGLQHNDPKVKVISFRRNYGKAAALCVGFAEATGEVVFTMDADLQDDPKEIPRFIEKLNEGYDLVSGWKKKRHDPLGKRLPSKLFNWATSWLVGLKLHDYNCGFKAYRNEVVKEVAVYGEMHRYIPALAHVKGFRVTEITVEHHARQHGKSKYGLERLTRGFLDLLTVVFMGKYKTRPLHLFGGIGLLVFSAGCVIDGYILSLWVRFGNIQNRAPLLMLGVLLTILGIQFISTGLLAEMITGMSVPQPTDYSVKRRLG